MVTISVMAQGDSAPERPKNEKAEGRKAQPLQAWGKTRWLTQRGSTKKTSTSTQNLKYQFKIGPHSRTAPTSEGAQTILTSPSPRGMDVDSTANPKLDSSTEVE